MKTIAVRLRRGQDLLASIRSIADQHNIKAAVVLSGVGCVTRACIRDASGVNVHTLEEPMEIVSLMGTVSKARCHLHIALAREDLSTLGGHLMEGTIINTTCELILGLCSEWVFMKEQDEETGYDEIVFMRPQPESRL